MAYLKRFTQTEEDSTSSTSITLTIPAAESGDLIVLSVNSKQTATTPTGYTVVTASPSNVSSKKTYVYYKISDGTEVSQEITFGGGTRS